MQHTFLKSPPFHKFFILNQVVNTWPLYLPHFYFLLDSSFDFFLFRLHLFIPSSKTQHILQDIMFVSTLLDYLHPKCKYYLKPSNKSFTEAIHSEDCHFKGRSWAVKYSASVKHTVAKVWTDYTSYFFCFNLCIEDNHTPWFRLLKLGSFQFLPQDNILSQALFLHTTSEVPASLTVLLKAILWLFHAFNTAVSSSPHSFLFGFFWVVLCGVCWVGGFC